MRRLFLALWLASCATVGPPAPAARVIRVEARRFSYSPARIEVKRGEPVVLELVSLDREHGFSLPALGIRSDIEPGHPARVPVRIEQPGTYPFECDDFCGSGHEEMEGEIVVR